MDRDGDALAVRRPGSGPPRATRLRRNGTAVTSRIGTAGTVASVLAVTLRQDGRAVALVRRPGGAAVGYLVQETAADAWGRRAPDLPVPAGVALSVAVNRAGQAVVAWVDPVARRSIPAATRYSLGGQWKAFPAGLPGLPPQGPIVSSPIAVMGDDGSAVVIWTVRSSDPFVTPDRGAGAIVRTGFGPTADASALPVFGPTAGVAVSSTGTAMISWSDRLLGGDLWASRFAPVGPAWPIGIRLLADANRLEEGVFAIAPVGSRHGPVLVEASLETGPGPDGHVAFARDSRGAPWGAPHPLTFTRGTPAVVAGDTAGLIALAVDDDGTLVVTPYDRLPRVSRISARRVGGRMVVTLTLSRAARMTGTILSLATGDTLSIAARDVAEGRRSVTLNPVAPGRYRLHLRLCSRGFGCAPATTIVAL